MKHCAPHSPLVLICTAIALSGCSNNLYFGTSTSVGLSVTGTSKVPTKISFAHDRSEVAIVPDDSAGNAHSTFAALDSEWTWFNGFVIKQHFATGDAADEAAKSGLATVTYAPPAAGRTSDKPLVFVTSAKLGVSIDFGESAEAPTSLLVGYRRYEGTIMPDARNQQKIDPVYADISIIADDSKSVTDATGPRIGGTRVKQRFATGAAAIHAVTNADARDNLRAAVLRDPVLESLARATTRFEKEAAIQKRFQNLPTQKQAAYLTTLNQVLSRPPGTVISAANLQTELGNLNDPQIEVASQMIQKL